MPAEDLIWQDPVPAVDPPLVDAAQSNDKKISLADLIVLVGSD